MSTARYAALDAISAAAGRPSSHSSPLALARAYLASSSRRTFCCLVAGLALLLVVGLLHSHAGVADLAWPQGRYGAARAFRDMLRRQLREQEPQKALSRQLADDKEYITGMLFGGQSNQLLALLNLLYLGKELGRTVILPPFTAMHFKGQHRPFHLVYDLPRFYAETAIPAAPFSFFKTPGAPDNEKEHVTCWSLMEKYTGAVNNHQVETGFNEHEVYTDFWAVPAFPRSTENAVLDVDAVIAFLRNRTEQLDWIETTRRDLLPQRGIAKGVDPASVVPEENLKPFFDPLHGVPPTDDEQLMCVDATFYVGNSVPPPPYPQRVPLDPWRVGKAWKKVGQHLHWIPEVQDFADDYLKRIFGVNRAADIPPYISVHVRRGDFKNFHGNTFTPLQNYVDAVNAIRIKLQNRLDHPLSAEEREGKPALRRFDIPPSQYRVVATTDEEPGSELWGELDKLGWKVINHVEFRTQELLGEWYPSMLDGEILSRGQGFVGTQWSTFSMLSGNRVEYWQGGVQVVADPK
ncbi:hypothetical protein Rhopal_003520-T1 [Rhodotorula paludigena]|uniref:GDP-fucose protein O-fucosyltransferase 2 n=1 Tax=Rhodotorula paludigena TaxID=86838 RepID=A0AAV5GKV3_9BASI|nr:hypothetical protein Rhopal_003520-T1 [Rhodotorula paludigena]